jgi:hypothetical protein
MPDNPKSDQEDQQRISLAGHDPEDVLRALLKVDPESEPVKPEPAEKPEKPKRPRSA